MAFLMMFRQFGYTYALHPCAELIRSQILRPEEHLIPDAFSTRMDYHDMANSVFLITDPPDRKAFLVLMKFRTKDRTMVQGVVIPGPDDHNGNVYGLCEAEKKRQEHFKGKMRWVPHEPDWIPLSPFVDLLFWAWNEETLQVFTSRVTG
jgi:hypothetical protein